MEKEKKQQIAAFRFQVIADLVGGVRLKTGELERLIKAKADRRWNIPYSKSETISVSTIRRWLSRYLENEKTIDVLLPNDRCDMGTSRSIDPETGAALLKLREEFPQMGIPGLIAQMEKRNLAPYSDEIKLSTAYRFFHQHGGLSKKPVKIDRRRFEAEFPNDLWQTDVMHGPKVMLENQWRKTYLIAFIDDHSRLIPHAYFYLSETTKSFLTALKIALLTRGLPRKLYTDNGSAFRSKHLEFTLASLQIALRHARPYTPQGKGKIERFFKTVRSGFLTQKVPTELVELNQQFGSWLYKEYHSAVHSSTGQTPLLRFSQNSALIRLAPKNIEEHFRTVVMRTVTKDRIVHLEGQLFEAPIDLIGERVEILYDPGDPSSVEARFKGKSYGFLKLLDLGVNAKIYREKSDDEIEIKEESEPDPQLIYQDGKLFCEQEEELPKIF